MPAEEYACDNCAGKIVELRWLSILYYALSLLVWVIISLADLTGHWSWEESCVWIGSGNGCWLRMSSLGRLVVRAKKNLEVLFFLSFFLSFWPCHVACGILVLKPGIEPEHLAMRAQSPNHWTAREFPRSSFHNCWAAASKLPCKPSCCCSSPSWGFWTLEGASGRCIGSQCWLHVQISWRTF